MFRNFKRWVIDNRPVAIAIGLVCMLVTGIANYELIHFSSAPTFCKDCCHIMEPDVAAWSMSSHARRGLVCQDCHFEEGAVGFIKAKLYAQLDILHAANGWMGEPVDEFYESVKKYEKKYRGMEELLLPQYYRNPTKNDGIVSNYANEKGEWLIRLVRGSYLRKSLLGNCVSCHSSKGNRGRHSKKTVADFVIKNQLLDFRGKVERRRKGIQIPHAFHLDKGFNCLDCHQEIVHGPIEWKDKKGVLLPRMMICWRCHNDKKAPRDCTLCHQQQLLMNLGIKGVNVEDSPNYMYPQNAVCSDCHQPAKFFKVNGKVCAECHDEDRQNIIDEWQETTQKLLAEIKPRLEELKASLDNARKSGAKTGSIQELYDDANFNYMYVVNDGSRGVHNIEYTEALLGVTKEKMSVAFDILGGGS
ncbi:MAG: cytochrome c3 family protein [bacterium]